MTAAPLTPDPFLDDLTGQKLGDYELLRRLGHGGMAFVYLAKQLSLQRNVALKILKPELAKDDSYVKRFEREAQAAAALVQANIVQIYEVGQARDYHFIAQEYVPGRNLRQYLSRHGAVEPVMAVNVMRQCALALQKAGELGVIHRDIKPENIMLSTKGEVKITDFGLARIGNHQPDQALTQIGVTMGTPLYMSPEQVGGGSLDHRSDIYSLGVTAYHMLAGEPPFNGDNALAIAVQHVNDVPKPLLGLRPDIPTELAKIVEKMIEKKPAQRYQDARDLLKDLRKIKLDDEQDWDSIVEKLSVADTAPYSDTTSWSQSQLAATRQLQQVMRGHLRSWWRTPGLWWTTLALSVLAIGAGMFLAGQSRPASLLNVENIDNERIPRKADVYEQYEAARWVPVDQQERYWKAVFEYFPESDAKPADRNKTRLYNRNAKARLAELYLTNEQWNQALAIFTEFTEYEDLFESFQVTGHAGLAIVYDQLPAKWFVGGAEEKRNQIFSAIGKVGNRQPLLNEFIGSRYASVTQRFSQVDGIPDAPPPEPVQSARPRSRLHFWPIAITGGSDWYCRHG